MRQCYDHNLGRDQAKLVVSAALHTYVEKYAQYRPSFKWESDAKARIFFSVNMARLSGFLEIKDSAITFDLDVPFLFRVFKRQAHEIVEREVAHWLKKAEAGELQ